MFAEALFALLSEKNLGTKSLKGKAISNLLGESNRESLSALCRDISASLPRGVEKDSTPFTFIANANLGGQAFGCFMPACRLAQVDSLARFAALYADKVLIPDPFGPLATWLEQGIDGSAINDLIVHLQVAYLLKPLLDAGLVAYADSKHHQLCPGCYAKLLRQTENEYTLKLETIFRYLNKRYLDDVKYTVLDDDGLPIVEMNGPDELVQHGGLYHSFETPPQALIKRLAEAPFVLRNAEVRKYALPSDLVKGIVDDLIRQNYYSSVKGANYLTNRQIDFDLIKAYGTKSHARRQLSMVPEIFSHSLPVVSQVDLARLVRLRNAEGQAFEIYRNALSRALNSAKTASSKELKQIFDEVVRPEVVKIDHTVRKARKLLLRSIAEDLVIAVGAVGVGFFTGILPATIGPIVGGLGGVHYSSQMFRKLARLVSEPPKIMDSKYYFLWKLGKLRRH